MKNPYKVEETVMTAVKGKKVEARVTQTWNNEVQVKTVDGDLLWRTMYTVWLPGQEPLARSQAPVAVKVESPPKAKSRGKARSAKKAGRRRKRSARSRS